MKLATWGQFSCACFAEVLHFDQPFGLMAAPWDMEAPTKADLETMFKQFEAINTCPKSHSVFLDAAWTKTAVPAEVLDGLGYAEIGRAHV